MMKKRQEKGALKGTRGGMDTSENLLVGRIEEFLALLENAANPEERQRIINEMVDAIKVLVVPPSTGGQF